MLRPDTVKYFLFTIVRNLVSDYLRHFYKKQEVAAYLEENYQSQRAGDADACVIVRDLQKQELMRVNCLPCQRRKIYIMNRFEENIGRYCGRIESFCSYGREPSVHQPQGSTQLYETMYIK